MWVNNEIGIIQFMFVIGQICDEVGVFFFSDVIQVVGKILVNSWEVGVYMLVCFVYKFYGFKGVGVLYVSYKNLIVKLVVQ